MKLIKPSFEILSPLDRESVLKAIEVAGRTCYKSEDKITKDSASEFVKMVIGRGHLSVIEHQSMSVRFICDRGVSHELVRHRIASFSQESTRYCNYSKDKFGNELTFIIPSWVDLQEQSLSIADIGKRTIKNNTEACWVSYLLEAESNYINLLQKGWQPQQARSVLPNALKTEIVVTANMREWKEIFRQRCATAAHPQMRDLMIPLQEEMQSVLPEIFGYE